MGTFIELDFTNQVNKYYDGDYLKYSNFGDLINDNDGYVTKEQWVCYDLSYKDYEILVDIYYQLTISGYYDNCPGDYWTPPDSTLVISEFNIDILKITINDEILKIDTDVEILLNKVINEEIGY